MSDRKAFLIVGNFRQCYLAIKEFQEYLESRGISTEVFEGAYKTAEECQERLRAFSKQPADTKIVAYSGHGDERAWHLNDGEALHFDSLYNCLSLETGQDTGKTNFIFIADCCNAGSIRAGLWKSDILPDRALVYTSSEKNRVAAGTYMLSGITRQLKEGTLPIEFVEGSVVREGTVYLVGRSRRLVGHSGRIFRRSRKFPEDLNRFLSERGDAAKRGGRPIDRVSVSRFAVNVTYSNRSPIGWRRGNLSLEEELL